MDELWRALRGAPGLVEHADSLTRLNRARGMASIMITHSLADLDALATEEDRAKARGFMDRSAITVLAGLPPRELARVNEITPLTGPEQALVASWSAPESYQPGARHPGRGKYLIKTGERLGIPVQLTLVGPEHELYDTDQAIRLSQRRGLAVSRALGPRPSAAPGGGGSRLGGAGRLLVAGRAGRADLGRSQARRRGSRAARSESFGIEIRWMTSCTGAPRRRGRTPRPWPSPSPLCCWPGAPRSWPSLAVRVIAPAAASAGRSGRGAGPQPADAGADPAGRSPAAQSGLRRSLAGADPRTVDPAQAGLALGRLLRPGGRRGPAVYASWEDTVVAFMAPRSGKTTAQAIPFVLSAPGAVIATSNKSDLWAATAALRAAPPAGGCGCSTRSASPSSRRPGGGTCCAGCARSRTPTGSPGISSSPSPTSTAATCGAPPPRTCSPRCSWPPPAPGTRCTTSPGG